MHTDLLAPVPATHRAVVNDALIATFGRKPVTAVSQVTGGASAFVFRVDLDADVYLLRLDLKRDPIRNPVRGYECMRIAAEARIAPRMWFADATAGVAIMDFVRQVPLSQYPGGAVAIARDLGQLVAQLQGATLFPALADYPLMIERMFSLVRGSSMFARGLLDPHAETLTRIRESYPWDAAALVSSHNDPNARNILFDGERLWLIDWETAFRNDPLADVALLLINELAPTPELGKTLLGAWLGSKHIASLQARLTLMCQLARMYYACLMLTMFIAAPRSESDSDLAAPSPHEFRRAVAEGRLQPGTAQVLYTLGKMFLAGFLSAARTPEFENALAIAKNG